MMLRRQKAGVSNPPPSTAADGSPLSSLFVHILEPHRDGGAAASDGAAIASVERLPLEEEDGRSVGVRVVRRDGRVDVVLARLTPPTDGYEAALPLAQPVLTPVRTADGAYELRGAHVGMVSVASDAEVKVLVGPSADRRHIDGSTVRSSEGGVWEGEVSPLPCLAQLHPSIAAATCHIWLNSGSH
jgi:hypothetical protein